VRWERLFADLSGQLAAAEAVDQSAEVRDRARRELARIPLAARLAAAVGSQVEFGVTGAGQLAGEVRRSGPDWVLLYVPPAREVLIPLAAIGWLRALPVAARTETSPVDARWTLAYVLREIARDRAGLAIRLRDGDGRTGTIDRVGADHIDLAEHPADVARRPTQVRSVATIPFAALATVSRD